MIHVHWMSCSELHWSCSENLEWLLRHCGLWLYELTDMYLLVFNTGSVGQICNKYVPNISRLQFTHDYLKRFIKNIWMYIKWQAQLLGKSLIRKGPNTLCNDQQTVKRKRALLNEKAIGEQYWQRLFIGNFSDFAILVSSLYWQSFTLAVHTHPKPASFENTKAAVIFVCIAHITLC